MNNDDKRAYAFGPFRLDLSERILLRAGRPIPLAPKTYDFLHVLVERSGRIVTKEELMKWLWPGTFVEESNLTQHVFTLRKALGKDELGREFIETLPRRGYRFVGDVVPIADLSPESLRSNSSSLTATDPKETGLTASLKTSCTARSTNALTGDPDYDQLIGRETELQILMAEYRRTIKGQGKPVLIMGEAGVGKTQLARYFGRSVGSQGALCLTARFFDYKGSQLGPYEVFLDLLRIAVGSIFQIDKQKLIEAEHLRTAVLRHCTVNLPGELVNRERETSAGKTELRTSLVFGDHFHAVVPLAKSFKNLSRIRPIVMFLDDLQWADEASLDLAGYLIRTLSDDQLMLVALARSEETDGTHRLFSEWLKLQATYRSYTTLFLTPLSETCCHLALKAMFGGAEAAPKIPSSELRTIYQLTAGNPYFLTEMLRLLVVEGAISFSSGPRPQWKWKGIKNFRLPQTVIMAARAKLERLSSAVRQIVEQASVIGDEFRIQTLALLVERSEDEVEHLLREGVACGVLSDYGLSAGEDYRFFHTTLRRVLYDSLPPRSRRRLHQRAGHALELVYAQEIDRVAEALGVHYEAARDLQQTFKWGLRAGRTASARWNWHEAAASIERAERAAREMSRLNKTDLSAVARLELLLALGEVYYSIGKIKESHSILTEGVAVARSIGDPMAEAAALLHQGRAQIELGLYHEASGPIQRAFELYLQANKQDVANLCTLQLSNIAVHVGDYDEAARLANTVVQTGCLDSATTADAYGLLGWARALHGRCSEGISLLERALQCLQELGAVRQKALLLRRLHWAHLTLGQYESAISIAQRAREDFREIGDALYEAKLDMGIGQARLAQGLYDEAVDILSSSLECLQKIGAPHAQAECLWLLGRARCEAGPASEAARLLENALAMVRSIGDRDDEFRVLTDIARLKTQNGAAEEGLQAAAEAIVIAQQLCNQHGLGMALVEKARAHLRLGQPEAALPAVEQAIAILKETQSGEAWRAHWLLASILERFAEYDIGNTHKVVDTLDHALKLLEEMRKQFGAEDEVRRVTATRARAAVARDLHALLIRDGQLQRARQVARSWLLE